MRLTGLIVLLSAVAAGPVAAQAPSHDHMNMAAPGMTADSSKAFGAANDKMMAGMGRALTGDADRDFVTGMLPHHQGAVDMARVELKYGRDPALRRLAQRIVAAQDKEIATMQAWLRAHPQR